MPTFRASKRRVNYPKKRRSLVRRTMLKKALGYGPRSMRRFKIKQNFNNLLADGLGVFNHYFNVNNPSTAQDFSSLSGLYDSYRVYAFKIQFYPYVPNGSSTTFNYSPLYSLFDVDAVTGPVTSINSAIQYDNLKVFNVYRPWKRFYRIPKYSTTTLQGGYFDFGTPSNTGVVQLYGDNFDVNAYLGTIVATYYMECINRR